MRISRDRDVVVLSLTTAFALVTALCSAGATSHAALPRPDNQSGGSLWSSDSPSATGIAAANEPARLRANEAYGKLPLGFEINQGQTDARVRFLSRGAGYTLFLTANEAVLSLAQNRGADVRDHNTDSKTHGRSTNDVLRMRLAGSSPAPKLPARASLSRVGWLCRRGQAHP